MMTANHRQSSPGARRIAVDVGIVVVDMERALSFYRNLVGLQVVAEVRTSLIGAGQMVQLKHGESLIKLVALDDSRSERSPQGISAAFGYRYITLLVSDLETIMQRLEQSATVVVPVTSLGNGAAIAMVEDPDGNVVEFVQEY